MDRKNRLRRMMGGEEVQLARDSGEMGPMDNQDNIQQQLIERIRNPQTNTTAEEEVTVANNPRNWLAGKVNPMLQSALGEDTKLQIPEMTVADEKRWAQELPEQMAGQGSMKVIPSGRFGNILQMGSNAPKQGLGKVTVIPSAADKVASKNAANMTTRTELDAAGIQRAFREKYGDELARRKEMWKQQAKDPTIGQEKATEAFSTWVQEMTNKIRRGE